MTEQQHTGWRGNEHKFLLEIEQRASIRKMRLLAAAVVRRLQEADPDEECKRCADLIESAADAPRLWAELQPILEARLGNWRFTHVLYQTDVRGVAKVLRKLIALVLQRRGS